MVNPIQYRGEQQGEVASEPNASRTEKSQIIAPEIAQLETEIHFLQQRVEVLEDDQVERKEREQRWDAERSRLQGIIERQIYAIRPSGTGLWQVLTPVLRRGCI